MFLTLDPCIRRGDILSLQFTRNVLILLCALPLIRVSRERHQAISESGSHIVKGRRHALAVFDSRCFDHPGELHEALICKIPDGRQCLVSECFQVTTHLLVKLLLEGIALGR